MRSYLFEKVDFYYCDVHENSVFLLFDGNIEFDDGLTQKRERPNDFNYFYCPRILCKFHSSRESKKCFFFFYCVNSISF